MDRGVLVGCDQAQEWLLPWWWSHYIETNSMPVAFADFGMSDEGKKWCSSRGELLQIPLSGLKVATKDQIEPDTLKDWSKFISPFWNSRAAWFKKPFAFLYTPFYQTLWLDLDCEVLGPLDLVYSYIDPISKMGLVRTGDLENTEDGALYNAGVIVFEKDSPLLQPWADFSVFHNHRFMSDQDALSQLIFDGKYKVGDLPEIYNWRVIRGIHLGAVIIHWASLWGKEYIRKYGGLKHEIRKFV
jgi:hypothetical protein